MDLIRMRYINRLLIFCFGILFIFGNTQCDILNEEEGANPESDFAVKDTASIVKFRISDTQNNSITITRDNNDKKFEKIFSNFGEKGN